MKAEKSVVLRMRTARRLLVAAALFASAKGFCDKAQCATVAVVLSAQASEGERLAALDLAAGLQRIYPAEQFALSEQLPEAGPCILVGNVQSHPEVRNRVGGGKLEGPESYLVTAAADGSRQLGLIAGADPRGTAYGVYALLEKLGCGFFLSCDVWPAPRSNPFSFEGWQLADGPLVKDRIVFDWHNFLSGCSTWNFQDWQRWAAQSRKMGYNAILVHAYGNNPMVSFTFNGKTKPVGYLSTTARGRDWSTMHVNDVRRLWGGEVFDQPVFGADAAIGPEGDRTQAAQQLMRQVFDDAARRDMEVLLAVDVDTPSANPQELIETLPPDARFAISTQTAARPAQEEGRMWLANPDSPEGYRYYKAQVEAILKAYPSITCLVPWFRWGRTPWLEMKESEMPRAWQDEYRAEIAKTPEAAKYWHASQIFAVSKIVNAFDRAIKEPGYRRVQLACGTWRFDFLPACDRFFPPHVKLIGLDYEVLNGRPQLGDAQSRKVIQDAGAHRAVVPVIWAHHDDGNYVGRPYTPFSGFQSRLADANAAGFGIIHWTTRPLDLYFASHANQVWRRTRDVPLRTTCDDMAEKSFGPGAQGKLGEYFERWVTDGPKFGRETSDWFIDQPLRDVAQVVTSCRERLKLIAAVDPAPLTPEQRDRLNYFKGLEEFIIAFFQTQERFQSSQAALREGRTDDARKLIQECRPEPVIEQFARFSSLGGITRGEQGLVVSLNLRWLTHILRHRQALGLDPVHISFGPTSHDPLAQSPGKFTFDVTGKHVFWERRGEKEMDAATWVLPANEQVAWDQRGSSVWEGMGRSGITIAQPLKLRLEPMMSEDSRNRVKAAKLPAGEYVLRLLLAAPRSAEAKPCVCEVTVESGKKLQAHPCALPPASEKTMLKECSYPVQIGMPGSVELTVKPIEGKVRLCGVVLEPTLQPGQTRVGVSPRKVIFDTDIDGDNDDVAAAAILHALADEGQVEILAMGVVSRHPHSPACLDAINTYYGRGDIPIGVYKGSKLAVHGSAYAKAVADRCPNDVGVSSQVPDVLGVYRRVLSTQADGTVTMIAVGQMDNLVDLQSSPPDEHSDLSGGELVRRKVAELFVMAPYFNERNEYQRAYNFTSSPKAAVEFIANWPTRIKFGEGNLGHRHFIGGRLSETPEHNPARIAFEAYFAAEKKRTGRAENKRHCADPTTVLYAVCGTKYFGEIGPGACEVRNDGFTRWNDGRDKQHFYNTQKLAVGELEDAMERLLVKPPLGKRTQSGP